MCNRLWWTFGIYPGDRRRCCCDAYQHDQSQNAGKGYLKISVGLVVILVIIIVILWAVLRSNERGDNIEEKTDKPFTLY